MRNMAKAKVAPLSDDNRATDEDEAVNREKREKGEWRYGFRQERWRGYGECYVSAVSAVTVLASIFSSSVVSCMIGHSG